MKNFLRLFWITFKNKAMLKLNVDFLKKQTKLG
ncbi:hypothetical protein NEOCIP111885_00651 [Pseudoneobacillus rhizosphaerae]|uniref:Uncharacterized protein n=1 Tax=Pseudoneobacillus rhizosphaerae TaxID=2880968 RepID=A0A9C7L9L5_9BACI|nr:hypothetical protein NEOCIP111885_00651 [Pseudoneobacillus rhizosphaerae]